MPRLLQVGALLQAILIAFWIGFAVTAAPAAIDSMSADYDRARELADKPVDDQRGVTPRQLAAAAAFAEAYERLSEGSWIARPWHMPACYTSHADWLRAGATSEESRKP